MSEILSAIASNPGILGTITGALVTASLGGLGWLLTLWIRSIVAKKNFRKALRYEAASLVAVLMLIKEWAETTSPLVPIHHRDLDSSHLDRLREQVHLGSEKLVDDLFVVTEFTRMLNWKYREPQDLGAYLSDVESLLEAARELRDEAKVKRGRGRRTEETPDG